MSDNCFFAAFAFSIDPWPIAQAAPLIGDATNGKQLMLIGLPDGSLGLRIVRDGANEDYETDVIVPEGAFKVVVTINYAPSQPRLTINGNEIAVAPVGSRRKKTLSLHWQPTAVSQTPIVVNNEIPTHATDAEALLIRTIAELSDASNSSDWYVLLKSSAHLRLLLLDGLLHKANERHRLKIRFRVQAPGEPPPIVPDKIWYHIDPHDLPDNRLTLVNLDQLLNLRVFESRNDSITVRDVIRAAANADGGVHLDTPRQAEEELVLALDKDTFRFGQAVSRHILKEICSVVVVSSIPLITLIQAPSSDTV